MSAEFSNSRKVSAEWVELSADFKTDGPNAVVYLGVFSDALKIGISIDPVARLRTITTSSGRELLRSFVLIADENYDAHKAERAIHESFKTSRLEGEWFTLEIEVEALSSRHVEWAPPRGKGLEGPLTLKQAELGYNFMAVATPRDVYKAQIGAVQRAYMPLVGNFLEATAKATTATGLSFTITPGMSYLDVLRQLADSWGVASNYLDETGIDVTDLAESIAHGSWEEFSRGLSDDASGETESVRSSV
ncbi:GIY-YIG nuclease family protein [Sulfitobacter faviae]|uniref:GIY-YIG nuclease family protein n=1 Tax=Sulfitobacter faviae TaxID=1775881 RepID=UPI00230758FE|nr:GIY-YIG nuclease family protein [Sulfitobacter faviae]WCE67981.1 GIY-YIG nuclease family protein [Sulfitobacter faviae]